MIIELVLWMLLFDITLFSFCVIYVFFTTTVGYEKLKDKLKKDKI